jgi:serine/threonine protein kinase
MHPHVTQMLAEFVSRPSPAFLSPLTDEMRSLCEKVNRRSGVRTPRKTQFVVVEYADQNLDEYLQSIGSNLSNALILSLCTQLTFALSFLWTQRVVHRDLKLDNILVSIVENKPVLQVCDFGFAIEVDAKGLSLGVTGDLSTPGGNQVHLSPDLLDAFNRNRARGDTNRSPALGLDFSKQPCWALGMLMYEIAVGEPPFDDYPRSYDRAPPSAEDLIGMELPQAFCDLVLVLLSANPDARPTLSEAQRIMEQL